MARRATIPPVPDPDPTDDRLDRLRALRDRIQAALETAPDYAVAPLAREYRNVLAEIQAQSPTPPGPLRDLQAKRERRLAGAS